MFVTSLLLLASAASPSLATHAECSSLPQIQSRHRFVTNSDRVLTARNTESRLQFAIQPSGLTTVKADDVAIATRLDRVGREGASRFAVGPATNLGADQDRYGWPLAQIHRSGVVEEYRNLRGAMRHFIHLTDRPAGEGRLNVRMAVTGADRVDSGGPLGVRIVAGSTTFNYSGLAVWDAMNRRLPAKVQPDRDGFQFVVDDRSAEYPITIDPDWTYAGFATHPTDPFYDFFEFAASHGAQGNILVVGSPSEWDDNFDVVGAAHAFIRSGNSWTPFQRLARSDSSSATHYGQGIALTADYSSPDTEGELLAIGSNQDIEIYRRAPGQAQFVRVQTITQLGGQTGRTMRFVGRNLVVNAPSMGSGGGLSLITYLNGAWTVVSQIQSFPSRFDFDGTHVAALTNGSLAIFSVAGEALTQVASLNLPYSGSDVGISNGHIVVGNPDANNGEGEFRVYRLAGNTIIELFSQQIRLQDGPSGEGTLEYRGFGRHLGILGRRIIVSTDEFYSAPADFYSYLAFEAYNFTDSVATYDGPLARSIFVDATDSPEPVHVNAGLVTFGRSTTFPSDASVQNQVVTFSLNRLGLTFDRTSVVGGKAATGVVTLEDPAPAGGNRVTLSTVTPGISVPAFVVVPEGQRSASFAIQTSAVSSPTTASIFGFSTTSGQGSGSLGIRTPQVGSLTATFTEVSPGGSSTLNVALQAPTGSGGLTVSLAHDGGSFVNLPSSVQIPAGEARASVPVTFTSDAPVRAYKFTAGPSDWERSATINVVRRLVRSVSVDPRVLYPGDRAMGVVRLDAAAPGGGQQVQLASSDPAFATVPSTVTVAAGQLEATFPVNATHTSGKSIGSAAIFAGVGAPTANVLVYLRQRTLTGVSVSPSTVVGGSGSLATVTLSHPAGIGGTVVNVQSNVPGIVQAPASVTVPAGQVSTTFPLGTSAIPNDFLVVGVTANLPNQGLKGTYLTVLRPSVSNLAISPGTVVGGNSATGTVTLNGPAGPSGTWVTLSSQRPNVASVPMTVLVPAGATQATFTVTTSPIASGTVQSAIYARVGNDSVRTGSITVTAP